MGLTRLYIVICVCIYIQCLMLWDWLYMVMCVCIYIQCLMLLPYGIHLVEHVSNVMAVCFTGVKIFFLSISAMDNVMSLWYLPDYSLCV